MASGSRAVAVLLGLAAATGAGARDFFDREDATVAARWPAQAQVDVTPPPPPVSPFDRALLALCPDRVAPQPPGQRAAFERLLAEPRFAAERRAIGRLARAHGAVRAPGVAELADVWFGRAGFHHVFCGEPARQTHIGGLHFRARWLQLQQAGLGEVPEATLQGQVEAIERLVYTMPITVRCRGADTSTCFDTRKGYGYELDGSEILALGYAAVSAAAEPVVCLQEVAADDRRRRYQVLVVRREGSLRTFYPDATPDPKLGSCRPGRPR